MTEINKQTMQFLFGDRELIIMVADLLSAPVDVIVNPANGGLSHGGGVAGKITHQGGDIIQKESDLFIKEHGMLESGMVAITSAGHFPYDAIIHAVGPKMGEGHEQKKIELAVSRSLQLCDMHDWKSIAFPAISSGIFGVPVEITARAFFRAITSYWDARMDIPPEKIIICLTEKSFQPFFNAFQDESKITNHLHNDDTTHSKPVSIKQISDADLPVGIVELSEDDISTLEDDEIGDWFK
ncbi:MAG: macro domain-containing protein [Gammaproteobacteria bacterium]|nr:macro domain-containing protein [Gammaproteobacteria bacterium]MDH5661322.1 macro domain-containing protein [Gammaproteobacteria bacterium]